MEITQETIDQLYYHAHQLCEANAFATSPYLIAQEALKLTDTLVTLRDVDLALTNVKLNPATFRAQFGPDRKVDFSADRHEYLYTIAAIHWLKVATKFVDATRK